MCSGREFQVWAAATEKARLTLTTRIPSQVIKTFIVLITTITILVPPIYPGLGQAPSSAGVHTQ